MKTMEISEIGEMLLNLSDERLKEVRDFVGYLVEREKKHKAFVERVLKAEQEHDSIICNSVEQARQAILNAPDDDDEA